MASSSSSETSELAKLLLKIVTHVLVLRDLPVPELARLACVHKAYRVAWRCLREQNPGKRYAPPSAELVELVHYSRLGRASSFVDAAVINSMVSAGVDEHGTPLTAFGPYNLRTVDQALRRAVFYGHVDAVRLLIAAGADVNAAAPIQFGGEQFGGLSALSSASLFGHVDVVELLLQHVADVHFGDDWALRLACINGHVDVARLLIQKGGHVNAQNGAALQLASERGHTDVVQLLLQHGADVHAHDWTGREPVQRALEHGHTAVAQLLIRHGARMPTG